MTKADDIENLLYVIWCDLNAYFKDKDFDEPVDPEVPLEKEEGEDG